MTNPLAQDLGGVVRLLEKATFGVLRADAHKDWFQPTVMLHSGENTIARYHHGYPDFTGTVGKSEYEWRNAEAIEACVNFLRTHSAEIAGALRDAERWQPIESAPTQGVIELAVVSGKGAERKTMVAERSFRDGEPYWMVTHGWVGWTTLHPGWTPYAWRPLPAPPTQDSAMQQGGGGGDSSSPSDA